MGKAKPAPLEVKAPKDPRAFVERGRDAAAVAAGVVETPAAKATGGKGKDRMQFTLDANVKLGIKRYALDHGDRDVSEVVNEILQNFLARAAAKEQKANGSGGELAPPP